MEKAKIIKNHEYKSLLEELKSIITGGKYQAYKAVDNIKVQTYWQIGERIVREEIKNKNRADYEKYLVNNLTLDLSVGKRLLYEIVKFYRVYPIVHTVCAQLSWSHYIELIELNNQKERKFYENKIITSSWSIRELRLQIKSQLYQKRLLYKIIKLYRVYPIVLSVITQFSWNYYVALIYINNKKEKFLYGLSDCIHTADTIELIS